MAKTSVALSVVLLATVGTCIADGQVSMTGLKSENWQTRAATLRSILAQPDLLDKQSSKDQLIECLENEDEILTGKIIVQPSPFEDETYSDNYLSMLESAVFRIAQKDDNQRAYEALIPSAYNPGSEIGQAIASRASNLKSLLALASSGGSGQRLNSAAALGKLLLLSKERVNMAISDEQYREAKITLRKLITDEPDAPVREVATKGLAGLSDKEDVPLLRKVATDDVANYRGTDGIIHYPVREAAIAGLSHIAISSTPSHVTP